MLLDLGDPRVFGLLKRMRDEREEVLLALKLNRASPARVPLPPGPSGAPPRAWTDPTTGSSAPLAQGAPLELGPSGVRWVHAAGPPGT